VEDPESEIRSLKEELMKAREAFESYKALTEASFPVSQSDLMGCAICYFSLLPLLDQIISRIPIWTG